MGVRTGPWWEGECNLLVFVRLVSAKGVRVVERVGIEVVVINLDVVPKWYIAFSFTELEGISTGLGRAGTWGSRGLLVEGSLLR